MSHEFLPDRRLLLGGASALLLTACSNIVGPSGEMQLYRLQPDVPKATGAGVTWRLEIDRPDAAQSLDTNRISISRSATTMDYYANAVWTDRLTTLVQQLLIQAFESSGRIGSVADDSVGARSDYELALDIRNFEARYDTPEGAPIVVVRMHAKLLTKTRQIIMGDFESVHEAQASVNSIDAAVLAFNQACGLVLSDIVGWTLRTGAPVPA